MAQRWQASVSPPPEGQPLHLFVQAVRGGRLVGRSGVVPFAVGVGPWAEVGDRCASSDRCASPAQAQGCVRGRCAQLCASHRDCAAPTPTCDVPVSGLRVCTP